MENIKAFEKLYKINIPKHSEFEYYYNTLLKSKQFEELPKLRRVFEDFEDFLKNNEQGLSDYKLGCALHKIKEEVQKTEAHKRMQEYDYSKQKFYTKDLIKQHENKLLISYDIKQANFNTLKVFDKKNEIPETWDKFLTELGIHEALIKSKSFRQIVFGNLNPKRSQKIQHLITMEFIRELKKEYLIQEEEVVFLSHDEVIITMQPSIELKKELLYGYRTIKFLGKEVEFKSNVIQLDKMPESRVYLKTFFEAIDYGRSAVAFRPNYQQLHGAPSNKFFWYFKKYILNEEIEDRDLLFYLDGNLAKWII